MHFPFSYCSTSKTFWKLFVLLCIAMMMWPNLLLYKYQEWPPITQPWCWSYGAKQIRMSTLLKNIFRIDIKSDLQTTSWSNCSFPAFNSEVDTKYMLRVLSIPSDPFQELPNTHFFCWSYGTKQIRMSTLFQHVFRVPNFIVLRSLSVLPSHLISC